MSKRSLPEEQRSAAIEALRKSAAESEDGVPCWGAIARRPGMPSRPTLKRWWQEEQEGKRPRGSNVVQFPSGGSAERGADTSITEQSATEYWLQKWMAVELTIARIQSDTALVNLMKYQDEVWRQLRAAFDAESKKSGLSTAELETKLREAAVLMPAAHAEIFMAEFKRRKLA